MSEWVLVFVFHKKGRQNNWCEARIVPHPGPVVGFLFLPRHARMCRHGCVWSPRRSGNGETKLRDATRCKRGDQTERRRSMQEGRPNMKNDGIPFLPCEDMLLLTIVAEKGTNWTLVKHLFNDSSPTQREISSLRSRFKRLSTNREKQYSTRTCSLCFKPRTGHICTVQQFTRKRALKRGLTAFSSHSAFGVKYRLNETADWARELGMWPFD